MDTVPFFEEICIGIQIGLAELTDIKIPFIDPKIDVDIMVEKGDGLQHISDSLSFLWTSKLGYDSI